MNKPYVALFEIIFVHDQTLVSVSENAKNISHLLRLLNIENMR
jgi:hypothetical protein